jgi:hypothetical protein
MGVWKMREEEEEEENEGPKWPVGLLNSEFEQVIVQLWRLNCKSILVQLGG